MDLQGKGGVMNNTNKIAEQCNEPSVDAATIENIKESIVITAKSLSRCCERIKEREADNTITSNDYKILDTIMGCLVLDCKRMRGLE